MNDLDDTTPQAQDAQARADIAKQIRAVWNARQETIEQAIHETSKDYPDILVYQFSLERFREVNMVAIHTFVQSPQDVRNTFETAARGEFLAVCFYY